MTAKHTPGPWELRPDDMGGLSSLVFPAGQPHPVAGVTGYYSGNWERLANALLIAAAPELLEALQFVMTASGGQLGTAFEQAQAAIAKATGEQTRTA